MALIERLLNMQPAESMPYLRFMPSGFISQNALAFVSQAAA